MPLYNPISNSDLIHIEDEAGNFTGETVEAALAELGEILQTLTVENEAWEVA